MTDNEIPVRVTFDDAVAAARTAARALAGTDWQVALYGSTVHRGEGNDIDLFICADTRRTSDELGAAAAQVAAALDATIVDGTCAAGLGNIICRRPDSTYIHLILKSGHEPAGGDWPAAPSSGLDVTLAATVTAARKAGQTLKWTDWTVAVAGDALHRGSGRTVDLVCLTFQETPQITEQQVITRVSHVVGGTPAGQEWRPDSGVGRVVILCSDGTQTRLLIRS
jgi:hypothetical protein